MVWAVAPLNKAVVPVPASKVKLLAVLADEPIVIAWVPVLPEVSPIWVVELVEEVPVAPRLIVGVVVPETIRAGVSTVYDPSHSIREPETVIVVLLV